MRKDWIEVELGSVLIQSKEKHNPVVEQDLFYVGLEHIEKVLGVLTDQNRIEKITTLKNKFEKGQILYGKLRPYLNKVYLAKESGVCSTDILVFQPKNNVNGRFAHLFMLSRKFVNQMSENTSGVNLPRVSTSFINSYPFPLPPLPEQRAIVARIEELFSELDHSISNLKSAQAKLEIYRQAVLKKAFEGGFGEMNNRIGIPKGWRFVSFKELILGSPQNGLYRPSSDYGSGTKILRIDGFYDGVILSDYDYKRVKIDKSTIDKYRLELGDIVVNRVNSMSHLGKSGLVNTLNEETVFESNIMRIKINQGIANPNYVVHFISSRKGILELTKNAKQAVNQASINQTDVANAIIPLPPIKEQYLIVQEIESRLSVADKLAETNQTNLLKSESLRQSILKQAFEGKLLTEAELEACRKEADWEPAERLLERIKLEKSKTKK